MPDSFDKPGARPAASYALLYPHLVIAGKLIVMITREEFARELVIHGWIMPRDVPALKAKGLR